MFLKRSVRCKDGKEQEYWSLVENRRVDGGRKVVQRHVLYLGEINSSQRVAWRKTVEMTVVIISGGWRSATTTTRITASGLTADWAISARQTLP